MARFFSKYTVHGFLIQRNDLIWYKSLNGSCKASPVDTAYTSVFQYHITDCKSDGNTLVVHLVIGIYVL